LASFDFPFDFADGVSGVPLDFAGGASGIPLDFAGGVPNIPFDLAAAAPNFSLIPAALPSGPAGEEYSGCLMAFKNSCLLLSASVLDGKVLSLSLGCSLVGAEVSLSTIFFLLNQVVLSR
jgi:hypothetical protein